MATDMASIGVVGVGRIGSALVERLHGRGHRVVAFDVRAGARATVERAGARWATDLSDALRAAEFVITVLPGSPELRALADTDLPPALSPGTIWIDLTSGSPELGRACADLAGEHGVAHLDAPIAGGAEAVRAGEATAYVGGDDDTVALAAPVLADFTTAVRHVGPHGAGHLAKLLINFIWFSEVGLVTEALLLAQRHGLGAHQMAGVIRGSAADSAFATRHLPALLAGDYLAEFGLDRCVEELAAVEDAAEAAGTPHPLTSAVTDLYRDALRRYGATDGELLAAAWLEERAGSVLGEQ